MPSERSQLHLINKKACCYLTKQEPMRKDIISRPRGGLKILCKIKVHLTNENTKTQEKLKKGNEFYLKFILRFVRIILNRLWSRSRLCWINGRVFSLCSSVLVFRRRQRLRKLYFSHLSHRGKIRVGQELEKEILPSLLPG